MGKLFFVVKIMYVLLMYLLELFGKYYGCCEVVICGYQLIGECCCVFGVDMIVVLDVYWFVNVGYYVNCNVWFVGIYMSNELLYFICDMQYVYLGNLVFGWLIVEMVIECGVVMCVYEIDSFEFEYGMFVLMCYMNGDQYFKVVLIVGWCMWYMFDESWCFGEVLFEVIEKSDLNVVFFVSGLLLYCFNDNGSFEELIYQISCEFFWQVDLCVVELWKQGDFKIFCVMLFEYNMYCYGEGGMYDMVMLFGLFGWDCYDWFVEIVIDYFVSLGIGQINVIFLLF